MSSNWSFLLSIVSYVSVCEMLTPFNDLLHYVNGILSSRMISLPKNYNVTDVAVLV